MARALSAGLAHALEIEAPFATVEKSEVIRRGARLPLALTLSCMKAPGFADGRPRHCGACNKCRERHERRYVAAGVEDPTLSDAAGPAEAGLHNQLELADGDRAVAGADTEVATAIPEAPAHGAAIVAALERHGRFGDSHAAIARMRIEFGVEGGREFHRDRSVACGDRPVVLSLAARPGAHHHAAVAWTRARTRVSTPMTRMLPSPDCASTLPVTSSTRIDPSPCLHFDIAAKVAHVDAAVAALARSCRIARGRHNRPRSRGCAASRRRGLLQRRPGSEAATVMSLPVCCISTLIESRLPVKAALLDRDQHLRPVPRRHLNRPVKGAEVYEVVLVENRFSSVTTCCSTLLATMSTQPVATQAVPARTAAWAKRNDGAHARLRRSGEAKRSTGARCRQSGPSAAPVCIDLEPLACQRQHRPRVAAEVVPVDAGQQLRNCASFGAQYASTPAPSAGGKRRSSR